MQGTATPEPDADPRPASLTEFAERTVAFRLHPWQRDHLCPILERLRTEKGLRVLLHAPPQFGKSILTSQRLPAYLIGSDPNTRVGLACYNETHAANFGAVIRDIMASPEYAAMYPQSAIGRDVSAGEFSTAARKARRDAQPSFKAMGLLSGFVGRGVDTLVIDDPYKSATDAFSEAVNGAVWRWWSQTARPRLSDETNVVVMFHRYHDEDLAGRLLSGGGWEYYRFPAIADANADGADPTGREVGEPLSPIRTLAELAALQAADPVTFAGQFQGIPIPETGNFFAAGKIAVHDAAPLGIVRAVRAWDIASSEGRGDFTAGVKVGTDADGRFWILDTVLGQWGPEEADAQILQTAATDGRRVDIRLAIDPGSAGKRDAEALVRKLSGYSVTAERVTGPKVARAKPLASQVNVGNVSAVNGDDLAAGLRQMRAFPSGAHDDFIDAAADAFNALTEKKHRGVVQINARTGVRTG